MTEYFIEKDDSIIFTGNYMEIYIPIYYFEKELAVENGDKVELYAIFNFRVFNHVDDKREKTKLLTFKFPSMITTRPNSIDKDDIELLPGSKIQRYHILKYFKGDLLSTSTNVVQSVDNVEKFIDLLNLGKIPNTIEYKAIVDLFLKCLEINKINLDVPSVVIETMITEVYRDKNNNINVFRKIIGKNKKVSELDYSTANMREIAELGSTFTAITFEDIDTMITASINKTLYNRTEVESPIEKILKY